MSNKLSNSEIFKQLEELCSTPGYIYLISYFHFFSNTLFYEEEQGLTGENIYEFRDEKLPLRSELSLLLGLTCKNGIFNTKPLSYETFSELYSKTISLLEQLQFSHFNIEEKKDILKEDSFTSMFDGVIKENIMYGGESFYDFQYKDFAKIKYQNDNDWLIENKEFSLDEMLSVMDAINFNTQKKASFIYKEIKGKEEKEFIASFNNLSFNEIDIEFISSKSGIKDEVIIKILDAFLYDFTSKNSTFLTDASFNLSNAYPIFRIEDKYYLMIRVNLFEALYETPFFWFLEDKKYMKTSSKNRGEFTEQFSKYLLEKVFGKENVYVNIHIKDIKKHRRGEETEGEIDVLVTCGGKAIILQAKSKKLTIKSRMGDNESIQKDFNSAIQSSYNQGYSCAELIQNKKLKLFTEEGKELKIDRNFSEIYIINIISDHYPSLALQVREFLEFKTTEIIKEPYVMDIFLLDVITEFLDTPLHFFDFIKKRVLCFKKIHAQNELIVLSKYIKSDLLFDDKFDMITLTDDIANDLDAAMTVRRITEDGPRTPEGILTNYENTIWRDLINHISLSNDPLLLQFGFLLLSMPEDTIEQIIENCDTLIMRNTMDQKGHSITLAFSNPVSAGIIFHTNHVDFIYAKRYFRRSFEHMIKKYDFKENYAIYFDARDKKILDIRNLLRK